MSKKLISIPTMPSKTQPSRSKEIGNAEPEYDPEFPRDIDEAYEKSRKRKRRNRIIIAAILIIMLTIYFWFGFLR